MAVTNVNAFNGPFYPNGVATAFPFTFKALSEDEVALVDDSGTLSGFSFTVSISPSQDGGTVEFASAPSADELPRFLIISKPAFGVSANLGSVTTFNPRSLSPSFERLSVQSIFLKGQTDAALKVPLGEILPTLPRAADMVGGNKVLGPDRLTGVIGVLDGSDFRGDKGDKGDPGDQDGGAIVWLKDFIQEGDESASDAIQRCHDFLAERIHYGETLIATVMLDSGHYRLGRNVLIDRVAMRFVGRSCSNAVLPDTGSWFIIDDPSFTPFTITRASDTAADEVRGAGVFNVGIYQEHPEPGPGWAPTPYPHVFACVDLLGEFTLDDVYCVAVNKLMSSVNSGRANIINLTGQIFTNAINIDNCLDVPRLLGWHLWPYWSSATSVMNYQQVHCDAIILGRCDTPLVDDIFVFCANSMFRFIETDYGYTTKFIAGKIGCDFCCYGLLVESPNFTAQIGALNTQGEAWPGGTGPLGDAKSVRVTAPNATIQIGTLHGTDMPRASISVEAAGCSISVSSALWDRINLLGGFGAFHLASGSAAQVDNYRIVNSNGAGLSTTGGSLANSGIKQNHLVGAVNEIFAAAAPTGLAAKVYAEGPDADINLEIGAKGDGSVKLLSGLQLHPLHVSELPEEPELGTQFVVVDALSTDPGSVVLGGGDFEVVVIWLGDAWRVTGAGEVPGQIVNADYLSYRTWKPVPAHSIDGKWYPDGKSFPAVAGDIVLYIGQSVPARNGLWQYNGYGVSLSRPASYAHGSTVHPNITVAIQSGAKYGGQQWRLVSPYTAVVGTDGTAWEQLEAEIWEPNTFLCGPASPSTVPRPAERRRLSPHDLPRLKAEPDCDWTRDINDLLQGDVGRLRSYLDPTAPYDARSAFRDAARNHRVVLIDMPEVFVNGSISFDEMEDTTFICYGTNGTGGVSIVQMDNSANTLVARANQRWIGSLLRIKYQVPPTSASTKAILIYSDADNVHFDLDVLLENCGCGVFFDGGNTNVSFKQLELGAGCMGRAVYASGTAGHLVQRVYFEGIYGASTDAVDSGLIEINSYVDDFEVARGQLSGGERAFYSHDSVGVAGSAPRNVRLGSFKALNNSQSNYYLTAGRDFLFNHVSGDTAGLSGITIAGTFESITINSPRFQRAQRDGIILNTTSLRRCTITDPMMADNNQVNSIYGGIGIESGTSNISIRGGSCGPSPDGTVVAVGVPAAGAHAYGIDVRGTIHRNIIVDGVDCSNVVQAAGYRDLTTAVGSGTTNKLTAFLRINIPGTAGPPFDVTWGSYLAYGSSWAASLVPATRMELYEKIEALDADRLSRDSINLTGNLPSAVTLTRASTAVYRDSAGILQTAAIDVARLGYRWDGAAWVTAGLLVEPASTNLITYAEDTSNAYWTKTGITVSAGSVPYDGVNAMKLLTTTNTIQVLRHAAAVTVVSLATQTASFYVALPATTPATWLLFQVGDAASPTNYSRFWFNMATGAVGTISAGGTGWAVGTVEVTAVGAGIYRVSYTFVPTGTSLFMRWTAAIADANAGGVSGVAWMMGGIQLEQRGKATSIMTTAGSTASRSADVASIDWKTARKSPKGPISIRYTFGDGSTQTPSAAALVSGVSTIPTTLNRTDIKFALNLTSEG